MMFPAYRRCDASHFTRPSQFTCEVQKNGFIGRWLLASLYEVAFSIFYYWLCAIEIGISDRRWAVSRMFD